VLDDGLIRHAANPRQRRHRSVQRLGCEVTQREGLVGGEAGGAELLVGGIEEFLRYGMKEFGAGVVFGNVRVEAADKACLDRRRCLAVQLLVDDGFASASNGDCCPAMRKVTGPARAMSFASFGSAAESAATASSAS
jgi:hypothetical protein